MAFILLILKLSLIMAVATRAFNIKVSVGSGTTVEMKVQAGRWLEPKHNNNLKLTTCVFRLSVTIWVECLSRVECQYYDPNGLSMKRLIHCYYISRSIVNPNLPGPEGGVVCIQVAVGTIHSILSFLVCDDNSCVGVHVGGGYLKIHRYSTYSMWVDCLHHVGIPGSVFLELS